jgi:hypothetical protein
MNACSWNQQHPVGSPVKYMGQPATVRTPAYDSTGHAQPVAAISTQPGWVPVSQLEVQ